MSRKLIAQIFNTNQRFIPSKVSLYLRTVGSSGEYFSLSNNTDLIFDSCNFYRAEQNTNYLTVEDTDAEGYTGIGYIISHGDAADIASAAYITYPILSSDDGKFNLWIRAKAIASLKLTFSIDNIPFYSIDTTSATWTWINVPFVVFDEIKHNLSIHFLSDQIQVDKIYITKSSETPVGVGPEFSISPYLTPIVKLSTVSNNVPNIYYHTMGYITSHRITEDGWYSFNVSTLDNNPTVINQSELAIVLSVAGTSNSLYLIWDVAAKNSYSIATQINSEGWVANALETMSLRVYSDHSAENEYECSVTTPEATIEKEDIDDLSISNIKGQLTNTIYTPDNTHGQDVELDLNNKLINVIIDKSGSNLWNDSSNLRFEFVNQITDVLEAKYPGEVRFNLFEFKGQPSFSFFIGLKTQLSDISVANIIRESFKDTSDNFAGFRLIRKEGSYSDTPIDGEIILDGYALAGLDIDLKANTDYYYTIYTYDHLYRFSKGVQIKATTNELIIPRGISWFKGFSLMGYDLVSDSNTLALWHTDENNGYKAYDFGNSSVTLNLENIGWVSINDAPTGISGLRFNGANSRGYANHNKQFNFDLNDQFSLYFWIWPFATLSEMVVLANGTDTALNYAVIIDNNTLKVTFDGTNYYECDTAVPINNWTHIAITYNNKTLKFYYNGEPKGTVDPSTFSTTTYLGDNTFTVGYDLAVRFNNRLFGKISHISIHNIERDISHIQTASTPVKGSDDNGNPQGVDNGDRTVVLEFAVPTDYNYTWIRIVRNPTNMPMHETDGDIVYEGEAVSGLQNICVAYPYDVAEIYYFRIFTRNNINNWCSIDDASGIDVFIPDMYRPDTVDDVSGKKSTTGPGINFLLPKLTIIQNRTGNEKVWFKWETPSAPATRVRIYYSTESFPYYDKKTKSVQGGAVIFDSVTDITDFVHRKIPNNQTGFYALITFDRLGRCCDPSNWTLSKHFPLKNMDDSGIPLLEAIDVKYNIIDYDRIEISWKSPVTISSSFKGWFDDQFYVYSAICDIYGNPLIIELQNGFKINSSILTINQNNIEDAYQLGLNTENVNKIPTAEFAIGANGIVSGIVKLRSSPLFAIINSLTLSLQGEYIYSNTFKYSLPSVTIVFNNPLKLTLVNRDNLYHNTIDYSPPKGCTVDDESGGAGSSNDPRRKRVNGTYIRRKTPFTIRAFFSYKDSAINSGRISCKIYDGFGGPCNILVKSLTTESVTVLKQTSVFPTIKETVPILTENGHPTGYTQTVSYSDIPILAPNLPQDAVAFVRCDSNGFIAIKKMNLFFPSILRISLTAAAPESNNIDIREQFASAYLIDPDYPGDTTKYTKPPDQTIAKWELKQDGKKSTKIPFYSIDNVPVANGIYSYFRSGTARSIFFGPANPSVAGTYTITVSTTVRGLFGTASADIEIKSRSGSQFEHFIPDPELPRILAEFPNTINYLWADGVDYQKMVISRDPNRATTKYSAKFLECSDGIVLPLPPNTKINIQAKGYQILTGDVVEVVDPDGTRRLEDNNAFINLDSADVFLNTELETYVYFRRNAFTSDKGCRILKSDNCAAFDAPEAICYDPYDIGEDTAVTLSTKINFAGKPLNIFGGGHFGNGGRPPCVLVPIEPLYVRYLGLFINNNSFIPVDKFLVDNETIHYMFFELRYKGNMIDAGVPVLVHACDLQPSTPLAEGEICRKINLEVGVPERAYVYHTNQLPGEDADPYNKYSLVKIPVGPISPANNLALGVYIDVTFVDGQPVLIYQSSSSSSSMVV